MAIGLVALALLCGSIPSGLVVSLLVSGTDIRRAGSGNIGAANVARTVGFKVGVLVAVLDVLKGFLPLLAGHWLGAGTGTLALAGLAAVLGHDFSPFLGFRGGKGVATTVGVALALTPVPAVIGIGIYLAVMGILRYSSLASLTALALLPLAAALTHAQRSYVLLYLFLFVLGAVKHWENIVRLARGTEPKFRSRPSRGT